MVGERIGTDPQIPARAAAWHSVDGTTWTEVKLPKSAHARSLNVAVSTLGWAAVGVVPNGAGLVWTSTDGVSWTRAKPLKGGVPQTIIATADGFLIGGQSLVKGVDHPVLWHSSGRTSWTLVRLSGKGTVTALAQVPGGVTLAAGPLFAVASGAVVNVFGQGTQVASRDGVTWQEVASRDQRDVRGDGVA